MLDFQSFNLSQGTLEALSSMGYTIPTDIQKKALPLVLAGEDLVGQAQTGTGKTAAFGIPIVEKVDLKAKEIQALVLVPTRELAIQVSEEIRNIGKNKRLFVLTFYGGKPLQKQRELLQKKIGKVLVGTPGRIKDLINRGYLKLDKVKILVLDEADRMLDMGFIEDIDYIISKTPKGRQTLLFSATLPKDIWALAEKYLREGYKTIKVKPEEITLKQISQEVYKVPSHMKFEKLTAILDLWQEPKVIIFVQTKLEAEDLAKALREKGYSVKAIHGDYPQKKRETVMRGFKAGEFKILVATDVASRGLDIKDVGLVINYGLPKDAESYIHRIGRTGRAGQTGTAISLMSRSEEKFLRNIMFKTKVNPMVRSI
ncbi:DEAD/DEAH box helicase [Thermodesulfobacterium sp. TA1]|uniref:DEAD/DEAH box helicase n=1 Tax=Thermodesulfobacterium sp. TA1 TaxID=2234087 RepID=UPI001232232F|nr:DEAD/DEAH box helicase [Thermodesulfobacterium sp. TA1]QER42237.1 DEAD/DEAH box helicase [Thermodesulfobacterium sp. TA1]